MGCGKSSVGRRLSELLCCPFMDLDAVIEQQTGCTIPEIFSSEGEAAFRRMEFEALREIIAPERIQIPLSHPHTTVLSLGGGTVTQDRCAEIVKDYTVCIYLRTSVDTLIDRLSKETAGRPMLQGSDLRNRIETLMAQRSHIYEATAHHIIDTDGLTIDEAALSIINDLK